MLTTFKSTYPDWYAELTEVGFSTT